MTINDTQLVEAQAVLDNLPIVDTAQVTTAPAVGDLVQEQGALAVQTEDDVGTESYPVPVVA